MSGTPVEQNLGPLTTPFRPPSTCFYTTAVFDSKSRLLFATLAGAETNILSNPGTACYPSGFGRQQVTSGFFYSPGVCPIGYTTTSETTFGDETTAVCCPSGFNPSGDLFCTKNVEGQISVSAVLVAEEDADGSTTYHLTSKTSQLSGSSVYSLYASIISIRWASSDFDGSKPTGISSAAASSNTNSNASSPTDSKTSAADATASAAAGGMSTGAKIGIGVGIPVVLLILIGFAVCFFMRRRANRKRNSHGNEGFHELDGVSALHEMDGKPKHSDTTGELPADNYRPPVHEMDGGSHHMGMAELPSEQQRHELDSHPRPPAQPAEPQSAVSPATNTPVAPLPPMAAGLSSHDDEEMRWLEAEEERIRQRKQDLKRLKDH